jgi:hypothetical protein
MADIEKHRQALKKALRQKLESRCDEQIRRATPMTRDQLKARIGEGGMSFNTYPQVLSALRSDLFEWRKTTPCGGEVHILYPTERRGEFLDALLAVRRLGGEDSMRWAWCMRFGGAWSHECISGSLVTAKQAAEETLSIYFVNSLSALDREGGGK